MRVKNQRLHVACVKFSATIFEQQGIRRENSIATSVH
jgi:hypothetical protein